MIPFKLSEASRDALHTISDSCNDPLKTKLREFSLTDQGELDLGAANWTAEQRREAAAVISKALPELRWTAVTDARELLNLWLEQLAA